MELSDLPEQSSPMRWHNQYWGHLHERLAAGQLPHALMLVGEQYTGKSQLAIALSRLLLCSHIQGALNCGHCHACQLSASGSHGDFQWVQPEDKSRVIKIEQIRNVVRSTNKTAGFGLRKVIVLAPADSMNLNAYNALLKSLEEPTNDTYFILVCHGMYGVPPTIRSRCQILRLATPDPATCLNWLDQITNDPEQSKQLLSLAGGLPLLAHQLYSGDGGEELAARRLGLRALLGGQIDVPQAAEAWSEADVSVFLDQLAWELQRLSRSLSSTQLRTSKGRGIFRLLDEIIRLQRAVSSGANPGKQLTIGALLLQMSRELGAGPLDDNIRA